MFDEEFFDRIEKKHEEMDEEFKKLYCDPCNKIPEIGDRVVVAAGFLNMGHLWIRMEAEVIELGDTSVKVRFADYVRYGETENSCTWIHPALITDVLKKKS